MGVGDGGELHNGIDGTTGEPGGPVAAPAIPSGPASDAASGPASDAASGGSASARRSSGTGRPAGRPRKDGRPAGSAGRGNSQLGEAGESPVRLRVDQAERPPKREAATKPKAAPAGDAGNAQSTATAILQLAELAAIATLGPFARVNPMERAMIEPSMVRILNRMDADALGRFSALSDPIMLAMGLGMYGLRVWGAVRAEAQGHQETAQRGQAVRGPAGDAAAPSGPVVVSTPPPPAPTPEAAAAAANGAGHLPIEILTGVRSEDGYGGVL